MAEAQAVGLREGLGVEVAVLAALDAEGGKEGVGVAGCVGVRLEVALEAPPAPLAVTLAVLHSVLRREALGEWLMVRLPDTLPVPPPCTLLGDPDGEALGQAEVEAVGVESSQGVAEVLLLALACTEAVEARVAVGRVLGELHSAGEWLSCGEMELLMVRESVCSAEAAGEVLGERVAFAQAEGVALPVAAPDAEAAGGVAEGVGVPPLAGLPLALPELQAVRVRGGVCERREEGVRPAPPLPLVEAERETLKEALLLPDSDAVLQAEAETETLGLMEREVKGEREGEEEG